MKLRFPLRFLHCVLLPVGVILTLNTTLHAAVMHSDVSRNTYVDFASNSGRYAVGTTNALLDYIRLRDEGVQIEYTSTSGKSDTPYTMQHGMLSFDSVSDIGSSTAISYNYVVTAAHQMSVPYPTFTTNDWGIGTNRSIKYMGIEEGTKFIHQIFGGSSSATEQDYKISRLSKLITDVEPAMLYTGDIGKELKPEAALVYRVGGGTQLTWDKDGKETEVNYGGMFTVGGIGYIRDVVEVSDDFTRVYVTTAEKTTSGGASDLTPLPFGSQGADSGSPYFVWDAKSKSFCFLMEHIGTNGATYKRGGSAAGWTQAQMNADNVYVNMATVEGALRIEGAETSEDGGTTDTISGQEVTVNPAVGYLRHNGGNLVYDKINWESVTFRAVATGQHTWKDLSSLKNKDDWYGYGSEYLNATPSVTFDDDDKAVIEEGITYAKLYQTQNLVLLAAADKATYDVNVTMDTDLGLGYMHFAANGHKDVVYKVNPAGSNQLNSAGYMVDAGVRVDISLRNSDTNYMREWRKVGEGTLNICGTGNNEIFLNLGGKGETLLNQQDGYAAYNVLVNTGSTVKIADTGQIFRDLTFGNGGGTLDMNGLSMDWYLTGGEKQAGFTIHALTEEAVIANSSAKHASLTFKEGGSQKFVGSFTDDKGKSSLGITYAGGGTWELNGIQTQLLHEKSGLTVQNGTVKLAGTLTVHGFGSSSTSKDVVNFSTRENDWHYADATMNVTVQDGAVFELESHARLIGTVTVQEGGKYIMHEGVQSEYEYIEGGEQVESTAAIKDYYGHKGDVKLQKDAVLSWQRGSIEVASLKGTDEAFALSNIESTILSESELRLKAVGNEQAVISSSILSLQKNTSVELGALYLDSTASISSTEGATVTMQGTTLVLGSDNTTITDMTTESPITLSLRGTADMPLQLDSGIAVSDITSSALMGSLSLNGTHLVINLTELNTPLKGLVRIHFGEDVKFVDSELTVTALTDAGQTVGYFEPGNEACVYFNIPEPATSTLISLALSALVTRRKRK
ncbi:MAG: PEP-CTERM sorting domain-containing protein [Akkermansia sp.]|nr:PEP-CTERM sorting domain-containing protein [Akkermansia sp.]